MLLWLRVNNIPNYSYQHEPMPAIGDQCGEMREIIINYENKKTKFTAVFYQCSDGEGEGASCYIKTKKTVGSFILSNKLTRFISKPLFDKSYHWKSHHKIKEKIYMLNNHTGKIVKLMFYVKNKYLGLKVIN